MPIRVYANNSSNTLLFDSSRATIPTLFVKKTFTLAQVTIVGSGFSSYGKVSVAGLDPTKHFCFFMQSQDAAFNEDIASRGTNKINIRSGYFEIPYAVLTDMLWLNTYYPNASYFVIALEIN